MAFPTPPPSYSSALLFSLLLLLLAASSADTTAAANYQEFEDMQQSLRNYGYSLFTNAIATSDLKYQLLSSTPAAASNFTLFAPKDELLYSLDLATDAASYVSSLRYHAIPNRRHTFADLKNLSAPFLDTLLPHYAVLIGKVRDVDVSSDRVAIGLIVDGIRIAFPDLFVGSRIAVHGIDGILLTGLNMSQDIGGSDDESDRILPAGSPAPAADEFHHPSASQFDRNDISPAPASALDGNIPAEGAQAPNAPTPAASSFNGNIPAAESHFDWGNIPAAAANPTITQDQIEKMKRMGRKLPRKGLRKGRRHHRRHRALGDL